MKIWTLYTLEGLIISINSVFQHEFPWHNLFEPVVTYLKINYFKFGFYDKKGFINEKYFILKINSRATDIMTEFD